MDCWNYSDIHDYIKWLKHGYGKVLDHACREIRLRRMTREQAISLVKEYQSREPRNLKLFLEWLGITENAFHYIVDQHRNLQIWERDENWNWRTHFDAYQILLESGDLRQALDLVTPYSDFDLTKVGSSSDLTDQYILIGKGRD